MTDDEIRIAVGEAQGWRANPCGENSASPGKWRLVPPNANAIIAERFDSKEEAFLFYVPDYPNDLNAIAAVIVKLKKENIGKSVLNLYRNYLLQLMEIMNPSVRLWHNGKFIGTWSNAIKVEEATARQRAEAYLRTIGKWK